MVEKNIIQIYKKYKIKFFQMYGAAEATSRMSYLDWKYASKKIGSIGKPIPGGKFHLVDSKKKKISKSYKNGELEGVVTTWYEFGQKKSVGHYKDGKLDGVVTEWDETGNQVKEVYCKNGEPEGLMDKFKRFFK